MVLDNYRSTLDWWLVPLAKVLRRVHPDVFTWLSLLMAVGGGLLFWRSSASPSGLQLLLWAWVLTLPATGLIGYVLARAALEF